MNTTHLSDQMLAAVEDAHRMAPDNDHLYLDPTITEMVEFAVMDLGGRGDDATATIDRYPHRTATGRCDRCFTPLDQLAIDGGDNSSWKKRLHPVLVNAGRSNVRFYLCDNCIETLSAAVA